MHNYLNDYDKDSSELHISDLNNNYKSKDQKQEIKYLESLENDEGQAVDCSEDKIEENFQISSKKVQSIKSFSLCQYCSNGFDVSKHLPLLFKCGHFFCKACIISISKQNNNRITCPEDGHTEKFIQDMKVLKNLIPDDLKGYKINNNVKKEITINNNNYINNFVGNSQSLSLQVCTVHPQEKLTYYCYNSGELLCVHCAFSLYRKNNKLRIVEMQEKCNDIVKSVDEVLEQNESFIKSLRKTLSEMKKNKVEEENRINSYFKELHSVLEERRNALISQLSEIFKQNSTKIEKRFDFFIKKMQEAEAIKNSIESYMSNQLLDIRKTFDGHNNFMKEAFKDTSVEVYLVQFTGKNIPLNDLFRGNLELRLHTNLITPQHRLKTKEKEKINCQETPLVSRSVCGTKQHTRSTSISEIKKEKPSEPLKESVSTYRISALNRSTNILQSPRIDYNTSLRVKPSAKEVVIDTNALLDDNEEQVAKVQQQFNLKKNNINL